MEKICVVGLGYIGLPTASLLATKGFQVRGVDVNPKVVEIIQRGDIHIFEPDLDIMVKSAVNSGNLKASTEMAESDIFILAVPTPFREGHKANMDFVESAVKAIAPFVKPGNLVVLESTSPVGTTEEIGRWLRDLRPDLNIPQCRKIEPKARAVGYSADFPKGSVDSEQIYLAHCPERVLPGQILRELIDNDRIIGGVDSSSSLKAKAFYKKFVNGNIYLTDARTAELTKLAENAFRDVNIAFANELSMICDHLHINVWDLIRLANRHPRVKILQPGPGVGGHCIAVDPWFIVESAPEQSKLIRIAREVNDSKPHYIASRIRESAGRLKDPIIACIGLTFKPDVDDLRESPAIEVVQLLAQEKVGQIMIVEPHIKKLPTALENFDQLELVSLDQALKEADILVLLVQHQEFLNIDRGLLKEKVVFDTRGIWVG